MEMEYEAEDMGMAGQPAGGGPQPVQDIGFNQMVQNILWSRVQSLSEQEINVLDQIITHETYPVLAKLFPEMKMLFEQGSAFDQQQGPIQGQQMQANQRNPIVNDRVSRGLMET